MNNVNPSRKWEGIQQPQSTHPPHIRGGGHTSVKGIQDGVCERMEKGRKGDGGKRNSCFESGLNGRV